jgi:hypothetical protein
MLARRRPLLLAPLFACAVAIPAIAEAQPPPLTNYPACTNKASTQDSEAAHSAFLLGQRFFNEADYGSALHNFVDAYKIDCSKTELLIAIARANELSGNKPDAVHALETYLQRAQNITADEKTQIQKRIDNLKAQIDAQAPAAPVAPVVVPTAVVPVAPTPAPLPPPPPQVEQGQHSAAPWIVTAVGGAAFVAGGAVWIVGHGKYTSAQKTCPDNACPMGTPPSVQADGNTGRSMMLIGGGLFIGGIAVAGAGLIWHFVEPTGPSGEKKAGVEPVLGPGYAGIAGRF